MAHAATFSTSTDRNTGLFGRLRRRFDDYVLYRRTLSQLSALSARDLADLNIDPANLPATARRAVYGA
jgi:uncharacterized protein YjiS (DUF1127 family)